MSLQIIAPYAPLYCKPCLNAERDDEIWFGQGVEVLEELEDGWLRVRTCYGYESYLESRYVGEEPQGEPQMVLSPWADVLAAPKHQAQILLTLPRGSRVRAWGENKGWARVALPGGGAGYIKEAHLGPLPQPLDMEESQLRAKLVELQMQEKAEKISDLKGVQLKIEWGSQIRSYVFMPYTLAKDTRTGYEMGNIQAVMDGDIDGFINAYLTAANGEIKK